MIMQGQGWCPPALLGVLVASAGPAGSIGPKILPELSPDGSQCPDLVLLSQPHLGSGPLLEWVTLGQDTLSSRGHL